MFVWSAKNVVGTYTPNASLDDVGYYVIHSDEDDRPGPVPAGSQRNMPANDLLWASFHPGGVVFAFVDGSVRFISDDIDPLLWLAYGSRNGEEVVPQ